MIGTESKAQNEKKERELDVLLWVLVEWGELELFLLRHDKLLVQG